MPVRVALNMVYAHLMTGLDAKERRRMEEELHGWGEGNDRANRALTGPAEDESGGES